MRRLRRETPEDPDGRARGEAEERCAIWETRWQAKQDVTARAEQLLEDSLGGPTGVKVSYTVGIVLARPEAL